MVNNKDNAKQSVEQEQKESTLVDTTKYAIGKAVDTGIDFSKYKGMKKKIVGVEVHTHAVNGLYLKVMTEPVDTIEREGEQKPLYASRLFSLVKIVDEKTQIPSICWAEKGDLQKVLTEYKIEHYSELVGKEVLVVIEVKKDRETLSFA